MKILLILIATYYANSFQNKKTADGSIFKQTAYTAATLSFPLGTFLKITNLKDSTKTVCVKVTDKCKKKGIIDLSKIAYKKLNLKNYYKVKVEKI